MCVAVQYDLVKGEEDLNLAGLLYRRGSLVLRGPLGQVRMDHGLYGRQILAQYTIDGLPQSQWASLGGSGCPSLEGANRGCGGGQREVPCSDT